MRLDEITLADVLKSDQYLTLLRRLKSNSKDDISVTRIKNQVIQSWKKGMTSRKHYGNLLNTININIGDLIDK
jgi:hypothetical protein